MLCPHCKHHCVAFHRFYIWPFTTVTCSHCHGRAKLASQPWVTLLSFCLGATLILPIYWLSFEWVILCLIMIITIDYQIDKRLRYLQAIPSP